MDDNKDIIICWAAEQTRLQQQLEGLRMVNAYGRTLIEIAQIRTQQIEAERALVVVGEKIRAYIETGKLP